MQGMFEHGASTVATDIKQMKTVIPPAQRVPKGREARICFAKGSHRVGRAMNGHCTRA